MNSERSHLFQDSAFSSYDNKIVNARVPNDFPSGPEVLASKNLPNYNFQARQTFSENSAMEN